jgi:hypothetical protein
MGKRDWHVVSKEQVVDACKRYDRGERPDKPALNTFLIWEDREYDAKFIRGLAYRIATGSPISADDYSGGAETRDFFKNLGFDVRYEPRHIKVAKAPRNEGGVDFEENIKLTEGRKQTVEHKKDAKPIRIGRVILNLLASNQERKEKGAKYNAQKLILRERFRISPEAYFERIKNILVAAENEKVDLVFFPADAFLLDSGYPLEKYQDLIKLFPFVVSGALNFKNIDYDWIKKDRGETLNIFVSGSLAHKCGLKEVLWFQAGDYSIMTAISSTIRKIKKDEYKALDSNPPNLSSPVIVLDVGHHQYSGRYTRTMMSVHKHLNKKFGKSIVIVSYWKYLKSISKSNWIEPKAGQNEWQKYPPIFLMIDNNPKVHDILDIIEI